MSKKAGNLFTTAYLLIMFGIYPLYLRNGYTDIGKDKYQFFLTISLGALAILIVIAILWGIQKLRTFKQSKQVYLINWEKVSATDIFVIMYATSLFLSYALSNYREEALWGTQGWYMGLATWLVLLVLYFLISRMWNGQGYAIVLCVAMATSGIVCLLGILNRFSVYLLAIENRPSNFLSTIGNINWFCGYLSVTIPIGVCLFLFTEKKLQQWLIGLYISIAFVAAFAQGSSSIFLFFGALFFVLLWIAVQKRSWLKKWFLLVAIWGFSAQVIRLLRWVTAEAYNYDIKNLCGYLTDSNLTWWIGIAGLGAFLLLLIKDKRNQPAEVNNGINYTKMIHQIMIGGLAAGLGIWIVCALWNTRYGIPGLQENSIFLFNDNWGNGRGATFRTGFWIFREIPFTKKLLGVGPDCFSIQAYNIPELARFLRESFGSSRLTNAHNELLTSLVNNGIIGVLLYIGMFTSFIGRSIKKAVQKPILYIPVVCIICYLIHNFISFEQVLNLPFAIFMLAIGESILTNSGDLPTIRIQFLVRKEEK